MITDPNGKHWFKGNLHTHTTRSDGQKTPEAVAALYAAHGYDFLALTDHWVVSETAQSGPLLLLSGCEYNFGNEPRNGIYHITGVGMAQAPQLPHGRQSTAQALIDAINQAGGLAILAHPAWSLNTPEQIRPLTGLAGTEIYNTVSGPPHNVRPYSGLLVDQLACAGYRLPCLAVDDSHFYDGDEARSYIWVQSACCARPDLLDAIRQGRFLASQGPFMIWERIGKTIQVTSTPVERIAFFSDAVWSGRRYFTGDGLTQATYEVLDSETFVRIEAVDASGQTAWSSPIPV
jgi:hypothetical protein